MFSIPLNASFRIVKNRLTKIAAEKAGEGRLTEFLQGPTALAFVRGDTAGAKLMLARLDRICAYGCAEAEELRRWIDAGVDRIYLQILDLADLEHLDVLATEVAPHVT